MYIKAGRKFDSLGGGYIPVRRRSFDSLGGGMIPPKKRWCRLLAIYAYVYFEFSARVAYSLLAYAEIYSNSLWASKE